MRTNSKGSMLIIILVLLAFTFIGYLGYKFYKSKQLVSQISHNTNVYLSTTTNTPEPTASSLVPSVSTNFKTYINNLYGYQLNYPNDWNAFEVKSYKSDNTGETLQQGELQKVIISRDYNNGSYTLGAAIDVLVTNNTQGQTLSQIASIHKGDITDTTLGNVPAKKIINIPGSGYPGQQGYIFVLNHNRLYTLIFDDISPKDTNSMMPEILKAENQIISSFKFNN